MVFKSYGYVAGTYLLISLPIISQAPTTITTTAPAAPKTKAAPGPFCPTSDVQPPSCLSKVTNMQYKTAFMTPDGKKLIKYSPTTKNDVAFAAHLAGQRGQISLTLKSHAYVNHPGGSVLFPNNGDLASAFDGVVSVLQSAGKTTQTVEKEVKGQKTTESAELSYFVPIFRKFQFMVLNDLYVYLTGIYTAFSMTHVTDLRASALGEPKNALNKKSLIVDHLLNVIQGQMFFIASHHQPLIPKRLGLKTGALMLKHDRSVDPLFLLQDLTQIPSLNTSDQQIIGTMQTTYLAALKTIINFFTSYTSYITKPNTTSKIPGSNAFVPLAQHIANVMENDPFNKEVKKIAAMKSDPAPLFINTSPGTTSAAQQLAARGINLQNAASKFPKSAHKIERLRALKARIKPINPPLFSYDSETLRALKVIPVAANQLPRDIVSVEWPAQLVTNAKNGTMATTPSGSLGYPIAYFTTAQGAITKNIKSAAHLYVNLPSPNGPYAQEIKKQPAWLNHVDGIISILRGCLGDYSQLVGKGILQPCTEAIICKALGVSCPSAQGATVSTCEAQLAAINQTQQQYRANLQQGKGAS